MSFFQSFLVVGPREQRRRQTEKIAARAEIDLAKISPDVFVISPIKNYLTIDQIRKLKGHIFQKPVEAKYKLVIIQEAQKLTLAAQNALLKILEEPPSGAMIILEASDRSRILPTIRSRVVIDEVYAERKQGIEKDSQLLSKTQIGDLLRDAAQAEDPIAWLDEQMLALHQFLRKEASDQVAKSRLLPIIEALEKCAQTREMIEANVNPKLALANLVLSIRLKFSQ